MKTYIFWSQAFIVGICVLLISQSAFSQFAYTPNNTGYISFNLLTSTLKSSKTHEISLYGCNTNVTIPKGKSGFQWGKDDQILPVPFGQQKLNDTTSFYVSKYYIASPPVFDTISNEGVNPVIRYDIGLVIPDEFVLEGEKPVQLVYLNYSVLEPVYIEYIPIQFDESFKNLDKNFVPFKVECKDFPWLTSSDLPDGKGASGIGALQYDPAKPSQLFLPYIYQKDEHKSTDSTKDYLEFEITILNDILYKYEVYFEVKGVKTYSINLTEHRNDIITLFCRKVSELGCGCKEPELSLPVKP